MRSGGTLCLLGALKYLLSDDAQASEIRKKFVFIVIPVLSVDSVKTGYTGWQVDAKASNFFSLAPLSFITTKN